MATSPAAQRAVAVLLGAGALAFVLLLAGVGADAITDDPEAVTGYAVDAPGGARFVISGIAFGDGTVEISNVGDAAGSLDGLWLCQRPAYFALSGTLGAGESVAIDPGGQLGGLDAADGEMGLYTSSSFGDAGAIVSYVEWGSAGHGRASVAVSAGIWPEGDFVAGGGTALTAAGVASSSADWAVE